MDFFFQYLLSPLVIILVGKWIDYKADKYRATKRQEKEMQMAKEQEISAKIELIQMGLLAMLRDKIIQSCTYFIETGCIPMLVLENITKMHDSYKALGGNGLCDQLFQEIQQLPIKEQIKNENDA